MDILSEVKSWRVPGILEGEEFQFSLNDTFLDKTQVEFFIKDSEENDIFQFCCAYVDLTKCNPTSEIRMSLEDICVFNPEYRQRGIASFYLKKFREMCIKNSIERIHLTLCTTKEGIDYKKAYTNNENLRDFYNKIFECKELKVIFNN